VRPNLVNKTRTTLEYLTTAATATDRWVNSARAGAAPEARSKPKSFYSANPLSAKVQLLCASVKTDLMKFTMSLLVVPTSKKSSVFRIQKISKDPSNRSRCTSGIQVVTKDSDP